MPSVVRECVFAHHLTTEEIFMNISTSSTVLEIGQKDPTSFHQDLMSYCQTRIAPSMPSLDKDWLGDLERNLAYGKLEIPFIESEREKISELASDAPTDTAGFLDWYEALREQAPGQGDLLFPWLAEEASLEEMRWFIAQEVAGEAGFEDLLALTQLAMPVGAKLEMARNYWDEMGRGAEQGMHGPMLGEVSKALKLDEHVKTGMVWEAMALGNLMVGLACNRRYAYHSVGALGAVELTAPSRTGHVAEGLKRLGVSKQGYLYFSLHSSVDIRHSLDWNREVIGPLVKGNPQVAKCIAEGALMRLNAGARCFDRYREHFGLAAPTAHIY